MVEDPSLEIVETFSDWDYYSDDYYDDDPSIIKKHGTESGSAEGHTDGPPRKKKRKLSALQDVPALSLSPAIVDSSPTDANSFKGVLWRPPSALGKEEITLYEPGKGEKVALLSDWREVFKTSLVRTDWFQNGVNPQEDDVGRQQLEPIVREVIPEIQENGVRENRYATYSPPPLEIDDMNKSINRQREKTVQSESGKPQSNLREMMVVGDSEAGEPEEIEESAAPLEDPAEVEDENMEQQQEETEKEPTTRKKTLRVEVPAPSNVTNSAPPRKRGRKPKDASSTKQQQQKSPVTTSNNNKVSNPKKRGASSLQADENDENDEPDSKRRSRRIASVSETQPEQKRAPAKSNRGRKRNV
jgi:hypothetical protein